MENHTVPRLRVGETVYASAPRQHRLFVAGLVAAASALVSSEARTDIVVLAGLFCGMALVAQVWCRRSAYRMDRESASDACFEGFGLYIVAMAVVAGPTVHATRPLSAATVVFCGALVAMVVVLLPRAVRAMV
jgi:hypothetical protein